MDYEDAVIKMLATKENLEPALEIADILVRWKARVHRTFWQQMQANFRQRLVQAGLADRWQAEFNEDISKYDQKWFSCELSPLKLKNDQHFFRLSLQQGRPEVQFPLYYGLARSHPRRKEQERGIVEIESLATELEAKGFQNDNPWWIGWRYINIALMEPDALLRMATDKDREAMIDEISEEVWAFFLEYRELIESAHTALAA